MAAPRDTVDALECVGSIYFSDVRHKTRAAFILADELVEMCCKALALAANPNLGNIQFPTLLAHPAVQLTGQTVPLGGTLLRNHRTRNQMQHGNAAFTVDDPALCRRDSGCRRCNGTLLSRHTYCSS
jgi:hypothetical protein